MNKLGIIGILIFTLFCITAQNIFGGPEIISILGTSIDSTKCLDSAFSASKMFKNNTIPLFKLASGSATNGQSLVWNSGLGLWSPGSHSTSLTNATVQGDLVVYGKIVQTNFANWFDTTDVTCSNAPNYLDLRPPHLTGYNDTTSVIHPSVVYFPNSFAGYKLWASFSMGPSAPEYEQTFIRVSNDGGNTWIQPPGLDSIVFKRDSLKDSFDSLASYLSDPWMFAGSDGKLWFGTRATYSGSPNTALWVRSYSGTAWSIPKKLIEVGSVGEVLMSPYTFQDTLGNYTTWYVDATGYGRILIATHVKPDSGWTLLDTVREGGKTGTYTLFPAGASTSTLTDDSMWVKKYKPWHIGGADIGADGKLIFITGHSTTAVGGTNEDSVGKLIGTPQYCLFLGFTRNGRTLNYKWRPILRNTLTSHDSLFIYKAGGWLEDNGGQKTIKLLYSSWGRDGGTSGGTWRVSLTSLRFYPREEPEQWSGSVYGRAAAVAASDSLSLSFPQATSATDWIAKDSSSDASALVDSFWVGGFVPYNFNADSIILYTTQGINTDAIDSIFTFIPKRSTNPYTITIVRADSLAYSGDYNVTSTAAWTRTAIPYDYELARGQQWKMKIRQSFGASGARCLTVHDVKIQGRKLRTGDQWINR